MVKVPIEDISVTLSDLLAWSLVESESDEQARAAQQAVASIVNKRLGGNVWSSSVTYQVYSFLCTLGLTGFIENDIPAFWNREVAGANGESSRRRRALGAYTWVCANSSQIVRRHHNPVLSMQIVKALLVRNDRNIVQHIDRYFSAFSDPQIGRDVAKAFGRLGTGGESILIKSNYAVVGVSANNIT